MRVAAICAALLVAGCNTMDGLGMDMQQAGQTLSKKAETSQAGPPPPPPYPTDHMAYP